MALHVAGDVVVVEQLQNAAMLVAVKDDEIEFLDLLTEQFAGREGDQRKLIDRGAVLLLRRAQNGEVDEIDGGIRLQEIAPGAFAGVRLARYEQHAQVFADAFGNDDDAVVGGRQFALGFGKFEFDDVLAGVRKLHRKVEAFADVDGAVLVWLALAADLERQGLGRALVVSCRFR